MQVTFKKMYLIRFKIKGCILLCFLLCGIFSFAQKTAVYHDEYVEYREALELFDKEKYSAAREKFEKVLSKFTFNDEVYVNAQYHMALCDLFLFRNDAESELLAFIRQHPESPQVRTVNFQLGKHYYSEKKYEKALAYFGKVDRFDLNTTQLAEYYFKTGHAHFQLGHDKEATAAFAEIKGTDNAYRYPALYYYSHIAYKDKNYQVALEGFQELSKQEGFAAQVPFYITQIYFYQKKYEELIGYARPLLDSARPKREAELNQLLGNSYYELKKYTEAVPYLEKHASLSSTTRDDDYRLGYANYVAGNYQKAINHLNKTTNLDDELSQTAWYHIADAFIKLKKKESALAAYDRARKYDFNKVIKEESHYNYAKLIYETDYNPYHDAITVMNDYLKTYPETPRTEEVYGFLVKMFISGKNYESAYNTLNSMKNRDIRMQSAFQLVVFNIGVEQFIKGNFDKCIEFMQKVKVHPLDKKMNVESKYWIAEAYYNKEEYETAAQKYTDFMLEPGAISTPLYNRANYNIGYAYIQQAYIKNGNTRKSTAASEFDLTDYNRSLEYFRKFVEYPGEKDQQRLADAHLRIGDIYYVRNENENAEKHYTKAGTFVGNNPEYALFQSAMTKGLTNKRVEKIADLKYLLSKYPNSKYAADAKFEIAETYRVLDKRNEALVYYEKVVAEYKNDIIRVRRSLFEIAHIYFQNKEYNKSISVYEKILNEYGSDYNTKKDVLNKLKPVYAAQGRIDDWVALMKQHGMFASDDNKVAADSAYFESVEEIYLAGNCDKTITGVTNYLKEFTPARFALQAYYFRADCYRKQNKADEALKDYRYVIEQPKSSYTENALLHSARLFYNEKKDYSASAAMYNQLESISNNASVLVEARLWQMRVYAKLNDYVRMIEYGNKVLPDATKEKELQAEAHLYIGRGHMFNGNYAEAKKSFTEVSKLTQSVWMAEARYNLLVITQNTKDYKKTEKEIFEFAKVKPTYNYWFAKSYILLADNYAYLGDTAQAKATLKSIIDNYKPAGGEDDIKSIAQQKLDAIIAAETRSNEMRRTKVEGEVKEEEENLIPDDK